MQSRNVKTISEVITEILIKRGEPKVVHTVAKNAGAPLFRTTASASSSCGRPTTPSWRCMSDRAVTFPDNQFLKLLETASASASGKILAANPQFEEVVQDAVMEVGGRHKSGGPQ